MKTWKQPAFSPWVAAIVAILICGFVFAGCSGGDNELSVPPDVAVNGITLTSDAEFTLAAGQNKVLSYTLKPENATNKALIWESSDTTVAIASEGVVYAVGVGTATITVTARSGYKTATCTVHVTPSIPVTGLELEETMLYLMVERTGSLTPKFHPAEATNINIYWTSYNTGVASVNNGIVTGVSEGETVITATTADGGFTATCGVTVASFMPEPDDMVWIKPGTFMMGSPVYEALSYDEEALHQVTLTEGFYMSKHPVTQAQFEETMWYNYSTFPGYWAEIYVDRGDEYPVENVSWYEAIVYCNYRSIDEGLSPAYEMQAATGSAWTTNPDNWGYPSTRWDNVRVVAGSGGYRLPTEAQWEYACRAGTTTPFNTGDTLAGPVLDGNGEIAGGQANYYGYFPYNSGIDYNGVALWQTIPVGLFPHNAWGLYDMHGNVWEWCWDWSASYRDFPATTDPTGYDRGNYRIIRGGSYDDYGEFLRSAYRNAGAPYDYSDTIGFRVVRPFSAQSDSRSKAVTRSGTVRFRPEGKIVPQAPVE